MLKLKRVIGVVLTAVIACSLFAGCNRGGGSEDKNVVSFYMVGEETGDTTVVLEKINAILKEKTGLTIKTKYLTNDNYSLVIQSGEKFDLICAPDWLNYWENAAKGAFTEITEDDLKEYAPYIYENNLRRIKAARHDGIIYGIPGIADYGANRCYAARGDLMDKYGIETIENVEDIEKYLAAVKAGEPNLIPFDMPGSASYMMFAMFASDWGWCSPGSGSFGDYLYFDVKDPEKKLFIASEHPKTKEYTETMKRWMDNGYFSKSVLSNKTSCLESFKNGRSAFCYTSGPDACNQMWLEFQADDRKNWDVRFFPMYNECQTMYNWLNAVTAVSAFSDNKENALRVLNEMYQNQEIYRLLMYGIEGVHYKDLGDGYMETVGEGFFLGSTGINNDAHKLETKLVFPGADELVKKLEATQVVEETVNCNMDFPEFREIKVALTEVCNQYFPARAFGVVNDVDAALKAETEAYKKAGIEKYMVAVQKRLDDFVADMKE